MVICIYFIIKAGKENLEVGKLENTILSNLQSNDTKTWEEFIVKNFNSVLFFCGRYLMDNQQIRKVAEKTFIEFRKSIVNKKSIKNATLDLYEQALILINDAMFAETLDSEATLTATLDSDATLDSEATLTATLDSEETLDSNHGEFNEKTLTLKDLTISRVFSDSNKKLTGFEHHEQLLQKLNCLNQSEIEVVTLKYIDGFERQEISQLLCKSENHVQTQLVSALKKLKGS